MTDVKQDNRKLWPFIPSGSARTVPRIDVKWSLAPLHWKEFQGHLRKACPSHCQCVASAKHFLISAFTRKLHLERRREPQVHVGDLCGTLGGRKDLGRNVFDPLKGRRGQSDNSCSEVWVRCCMLLTPNARHRQSEWKQAETGMSVRKTAKGGERTGTSRCGTLTMSCIPHRALHRGRLT